MLQVESLPDDGGKFLELSYFQLVSSHDQRTLYAIGYATEIWKEKPLNNNIYKFTCGRR